MRLSGVAVFPLVLLSLLAGLTYWLEKATTAQEANRRANARHDPDYMVERFTVQRFNESGKLIQFLTADSMVHFPDNNVTEVTRPDLKVYREDNSTHVTADHATLNQDGKEIQLKGQVHVVRPGTADIPTTVIDTPALTVYPDDDHAVGSAPVTITRGRDVVNGSGIDYRGKDRTVQLSGRVHGTFKRDDTK